MLVFPQVFEFFKLDKKPLLVKFKTNFNLCCKATFFIILILNLLFCLKLKGSLVNCDSSRGNIMYLSTPFGKQIPSR